MIADARVRAAWRCHHHDRLVKAHLERPDRLAVLLLLLLLLIFLLLRSIASWMHVLRAGDAWRPQVLWADDLDSLVAHPDLVAPSAAIEEDDLGCLAVEMRGRLEVHELDLCTHLELELVSRVSLVSRNRLPQARDRPASRRQTSGLGCLLVLGEFGDLALPWSIPGFLGALRQALSRSLSGLAWTYGKAGKGVEPLIIR